MPCMKLNNNGFTFVEILIVSVITSLISLAIYATFNSGIKVWQRVSEQVPSADLNIFLSRFNTDLKNTFKFTGIDFLGTENALEFATLVKSNDLKIKTVGRAAYFYEPEDGVLKRRQDDFSQIYNKDEGRITKSIANIKSFKFQYYFFDKEKNKYAWADEWIGRAGLPLAVRMELELDDGKQIHKFHKYSQTVEIPASA